MTTAGLLYQGRKAFDRQAWTEAYARLSEADQASPIEPDDLDKLAIAAYLTGHEEESTETWTRAHQACLKKGELERAVRCIFWLAFALMNRGERARAGGWSSRGRRLLDDAGRDCVERGYLQLPAAFERLGSGDLAGAYAAFCAVAEVGDRFGDADLIALARHSSGRLLIRMGRPGEGVALLDEAMAAVDAGELSPIVVGVVYCSVIEGCLEIFDHRRAQEWTEALNRWCEAQPDLVAYRGECLVRRAEILQVHGAWQDALEAAQQACDRFMKAPSIPPLTGAAFYQKAELHRLRGEFAEAEEAYRQASQWGRNPQPGLALLRLGEGRLEAATRAILRAVEEAQDRTTRCRLLSAHVEIMLAAGDLDAARVATLELTRIAGDLGTPFLQAIASHSLGALLLAEGDLSGALAALRRTWDAWQAIEVPREAARIRVLIGRACRELGDEDTATLEFDAARRVFRQLGAAPDLHQLGGIVFPSSPEPAENLTPRQVEVLRHIAAGKTNREIAVALSISEKTVARHVSNILGELELPNRAAATAYAFQEGLV